MTTSFTRTARTKIKLLLDLADEFEKEAHGLRVPNGRTIPTDPLDSPARWAASTYDMVAYQLRAKATEIETLAQERLRWVDAIMEKAAQEKREG